MDKQEAAWVEEKVCFQGWTLSDPLPNLSFSSRWEGRRKSSPQERHTWISERSAHKLLQHEGRADNLGFVCPAKGLGHQEHIREEEQVHIQLRASEERDEGQLERGQAGQGLGLTHGCVGRCRAVG